MSLKQKTITGVFWTVSQQFGTQIINFVVQIILARILLPEMFGMIAMLHIFMAVGQSLMDAGMTSSLIRTKNAEEADYSTVFFMNLIFSLVVYLVLYVSAPVIAKFYDQALLTEIVRVYSLTFIIQALVAVQATRLTKQMNFKKQMLMQIPATLAGGIIGVMMAYNGYGVWSLVFLNLGTSLVLMLLLWIGSDWKPKLLFSKTKFLTHFNFGYKLTLSNLLAVLYKNSYTLIIGKIYSAGQLGFYSQANTLRMIPVQHLTSALQKVTYPMFSSIQDDDARLKHAFTRITKLVFFVVTPCMLYLILVAEPLFRFLLTDKWLPAVPFFQILCVGAIFYPQGIYNLNIISVKGRTDLHLKMELIKKVVSLSFLVLIFPFGLWGVIIAQVLGQIFHSYINMLYCGRMINYKFSEQIMDILPVVVIGTVSFLITYMINIYLSNFLFKEDWVVIIFNGLIYFSVYIVMCLQFKISSIKELMNIVNSRLKRTA